MAKNTLKDKFIGCLVGAGIGDALGMPNEDIPREKSEKYYPGGITDFIDPHPNTPCRMLKAGQHTDDTQLMIALSESLVEKKQFSPEHFGEKLKEWYHNEPHQKRYRGEATKAGIKNLIKGKNWQESGVNKAGCGGSTRAIPIGLFFFQNLQSVIKYSPLQCHITHNNQIAKDGAVCVATTISHLLKDEDIFIDSLLKLVKSGEFKAKIEEIKRVVTKKIDVHRAIETLGNSSLATEVVGLSQLIFLTEPSNFEKAVLLAANATGERGGDTDSIAFLVGAFSGAYNGIGKIRKDWIERVENGQYLGNLAESLYTIACELDRER